MGATPGKERKRDFVDNPNGLFSAQAAPKPPPAMYAITQGMKVGGKVIKCILFFLLFFLIQMEFGTLLPSFPSYHLISVFTLYDPC